MVIRKALIPLMMALALIGGCSGKKSDRSGVIQSAGQNGAASLTASSITVPGTWVNGIGEIEKNTFIVKLDQPGPAPVGVGYQLTFARTGNVVVTRVQQREKKEGLAFVVTVDKPLDPLRDGYPHPIAVSAGPLWINPAPAQKEKMWRNGVNLVRTHNFVFWIGKNASIPVKIGDRLVFAASGEAVVKDVRCFQETAIVVTVDKSLDPEGDGWPHSVRLKSSR